MQENKRLQEEISKLKQNLEDAKWMNEVYEKSFNRMSKDRAQLLRVCYACCHVFVFLLSKLLTFDG